VVDVVSRFTGIPYVTDSEPQEPENKSDNHNPQEYQSASIHHLSSFSERLT
jgi:hypothetical protein